MNPLIQYWYFHLPNFILAAVMYSLLGRIAMSFLVPANSGNYIFRAFVRITEPALRVVRFITPAGVPLVITLLFGVLWLLLLRGAIFLILGAYGLLPSVGAA